MLLKFLFRSVYLRAIEKVRCLPHSREIQFNKVGFKLYYTSASIYPWLFQIEGTDVSVGKQICGVFKRWYLNSRHPKGENKSPVICKAILIEYKESLGRRDKVKTHLGF